MCSDNKEAATKLTDRETRKEVLLGRWKRSQEREGRGLYLAHSLLHCCQRWQLF